MLQLFNRKGRRPNAQDLEKAETVAPVLTSFIRLTQQLNDAQSHLSAVQRSYKGWLDTDGPLADRLLAID